jgi:redox-sensing transcriptional repressor
VAWSACPELYQPGSASDRREGSAPLGAFPDNAAAGEFLRHPWQNVRLVKQGNKGRPPGSAAGRTESTESVSELTTNRLSVYLRCLGTLDEEGVRTISSQAMADRFGLNAAQIRKDLANFGEFGVRGIGYYVTDLRRHLREILGVDRRLGIAIIGAGNLGMALADYPGFRMEGFRIAGLFDDDRRKIGGRSRAGVPIHDIRHFRRLARRERVRIAVIAVPASAAQGVLDTIVAAGITAVLNFSPGTLKAPPRVKLKSVDLTVSLESLSYFLATTNP